MFDVIDTPTSLSPVQQDPLKCLPSAKNAITFYVLEFHVHILQVISQT